MQICRQGNGHYLDGLNNQDYFFAEGNVKLITDGCSSGRFSEVGTRLFCQLFSQLEDRLEITKFEENVDTVFKKILSLKPSNCDSDANDFVHDNLLFTIVACFELEDKFVVKSIGDGYIITVNNADLVSYIRLFYGEKPPYYSYNILESQLYPAPLTFKTFEFSKRDFKKVGIASDGISPIAEKKVEDSFDPFFLEKHSVYTPEGIIRSNHTAFYDDITILF